MTPPNLPTVSPEAVTPGDVEEAASELGLKQFRVETLKAHKILGRHLWEVGVAQVGRGVYLANLEQLTEMQKRVAGMIEDMQIDPGIQAKLVGAFATLSKTINEAAAGLIGSGDPKPDTQQRPQIGLPPPPSRVLINVQGGTVKVQDGRQDDAVPQGVGQPSLADE